MNGNFEFVLGMYGIIAGLGVSRLLEGIRMVTQPGSAVRAHWLHWCMGSLGLLVLATTWLALWPLRHVDVWNVWGFLFVLTVPSLMYLFSASILPVMEDAETRAMAPADRYFLISRRIHSLLAAALLFNALSELVVKGRFDDSALALMRGVLIVLLSACAVWNRSERLHRVVVPLLAVIGVSMPIFLDMNVVE